jgi:hypothetical protein
VLLNSVGHLIHNVRGHNPGSRSPPLIDLRVDIAVGAGEIASTMNLDHKLPVNRTGARAGPLPLVRIGPRVMV